MTSHLQLPHPPPPDPPELPEGADPRPRWPAWYGPVAFISAFIAISIVLGTVIAATGQKDATDDPTFTVIATFFQDAVLVAFAVMFANFIRRPRPWHFGLTRSKFWSTVGWAALGAASFLVISIVYTKLVHPPEDAQKVTQDLGADNGLAAQFAAAAVIVWLAPVAEEIFFRGFFYRSLRSRFAVWSAALIDGVVFGAIHYAGTDTLKVLPVLAVLGVMFCLVYEKTGSIYPVICLHALNNSLAFAANTDTDKWVGPVFGVILIAGTIVVARRSRPRVAYS